MEIQASLFQTNRSWLIFKSLDKSSMFLMREDITQFLKSIKKNRNRYSLFCEKEVNPDLNDCFNKHESSVEFLLKKENIQKNMYNSYFSLFLTCQVERETTLIFNKCVWLVCWSHFINIVKLTKTRVGNHSRHSRLHIENNHLTSLGIASFKL